MVFIIIVTKLLTHSLLPRSHGCHGECVWCDGGPVLLWHRLGPDETTKNIQLALYDHKHLSTQDTVFPLRRTHGPLPCSAAVC